MGKLIQNILDSLKLTDEEDDFDDDDFMETRSSKREREQPKQAVQEREPLTPPKRFESSRSYNKSAAPRQISSYEDDDYESPKRERTSYSDRQQTGGRIVPIRPATQGLEVCIMKPNHFEDSQGVCDMLKNERAIILNLEGMDLALAQRIMDFISGSIYSLNAKIHQISGYVFCISPEKVDISGDYMDMIQQPGFEVPNLTRN